MEREGREICWSSGSGLSPERRSETRSVGTVGAVGPCALKGKLKNESGFIAKHPVVPPEIRVIAQKSKTRVLARAPVSDRARQVIQHAHF